MKNVQFRKIVIDTYTKAGIIINVDFSHCNVILGNHQDSHYLLNYFFFQPTVYRSLALHYN